ncbi:MAG: hypothetical protein A2X59_08135 [Nitrospirae bacterium GWC2_42_7]|nr:MAG: hypothetical protein A2X59_08135 [Nitrospirae bacterium GWC2_42_7]
MKNDKALIKQDLESKKTDYFARNYSEQSGQNLLRRMRRHLIFECIREVQPASHVLDIGCGPAILFPELLASSKEYVAADLVGANLQEIKKNNPSPNLILVEADMDSFDWQHNYFDIIICSGAIEYTAEPEKNLLKLIALLRNNGQLICSFPNGRSPYRLWGEYVYRHIWRAKNALTKKTLPAYRRKLFSSGHIVNLIEESISPQELHITHFGHKFLPQPLDQLLRNVDCRLTTFGAEHSNSFLQPFCTEFLLWMRK